MSQAHAAQAVVIGSESYLQSSGFKRLRSAEEAKVSQSHVTDPRKVTMRVVHAFCPYCGKEMSELMIGGVSGLEEAEKRARKRVCQHMWAKHHEASTLTRPGWDVMYWSLEVEVNYEEYTVRQEGRPTHSWESQRPLPAMSSGSSSSSWSSGPRERRCRGPVHMRRRAPSALARFLPRAAQSPTPEARQTTDAATGGLGLEEVIGVLLRTQVRNLPHLLAPLLGSLPTDQLNSTVQLVVEELRRREASSPGWS